TRHTAQAVRATAQTAAVTAKAAARSAVAAAKAVIAAAQALLSALAAGGGVVLALVVVVCLVGILIVSPFGIFFADGGNAPDAVSPSAAVAQLNRELVDRLEELQAGGTYDSVEVHGQPPGWPEALAVFAARTAGAEDGVDVAVLDPERVERLRTVFWDMTKLTTQVETIEHTGT
ncbi:peptidoglycan endopeptidase, partial [Clostridioides difficile]|nr:peptidoglycan endopeptidase [Clostridioides difficile]